MSETAVGLAAVAELFDQLCDLPSRERRHRLAAIAADDPALAGRLEKWLAADEQPLGPLERARPAVAEATQRGLAAGTAVPERLGAWRVGERLGAGGMGEVYRGEREEGGFLQRAALKIVRAGMASDAIVARFVLERQVLAQLEHPAIARLLDGGVAPDGRPWFAMELVEGVPITTFASAAALSVERRLDLVIEVAEAVAYAHRSLVVHRDLKPTNILVTAAGDPKLLDFGLAKLLAPGSDPGLTRSEVRALTPAYAAPEQIAGEAITTATDVYALGVLLYELLTGTLPDDEPLRGDSAATRQRVERPSVRVLRLAREDHMRRSKRLAGDLDTIVLRALAAEPARRYPSAADLAEDLRAHLDGRPVAARPDTRRYRLGKFIGRHRVAVTAAVLITLSLCGGFVAALVSAERAERQARRATEVQRFLVSLFEAADPDRSLGADVTARQLLDAGVAELERGLIEEPEVRAALFDTVAQIERRIGRYESAEELARAAVEAHSAQWGTSVERAAAQVTLGEVLHARGELDEAAAALEAAVRVLVAEQGVDGPVLARAKAALAETEFQRGRKAEALALATDVLERARRVHGADHADTARARIALATILALDAKFDQALIEMEAAVGTLDQALGADHPRSNEARLSLAELLGYLGERDRAHALYEQAISAFRRAFGDRHVLVAQSLLKRSLLYLNQGRPQEADRDLEEASAIFTELGHYEAASCERMLGHSLLAQGRPAEAAVRFERAYDQFKARLGDRHVLTLAALGNLGTAKVQQGAPEAAVRILDTAIAGLEEVQGQHADDLRQPLLSLGEAKRRLGDFDGALVHHRRSLAIAEAGVGADHPGAANARREIALDLAAREQPGDLAAGLEELDRAIAIRRTTDPSSPRLAGWVLESAELAGRLGDEEGAAGRRREAVTLLEQALGADHPEVLAARETLAGRRGRS